MNRIHINITLLIMRLKNLSISLILLFFCFGTTFAQDSLSVYSIKIDSLHQLIDSHQNEDEELVRLLNEYARVCFYNMDFQKGLMATRNARILSDNLNFEGGKIMYYLTLSVFFGYGEMHDYYQRQAQLLSKNVNEQSSAYFTDLNIPGYNVNDWEVLIDKHYTTLKQFEDLDDKEIQAAILEDIGWGYFNLGNREETLKIIDKIINIYTELDQIYPLYLHKSRKMNTLNDLGREDEAREIELELIELIAQNTNENAIGVITSTMASGYANSGRYALSIEYYLKSIDVFERNGDHEMLFRTHYNMGVAYENLEMNSRAVDSYAKCLVEIQNLNDSSRLYVAYNFMVSPLIALRRYEEAKKYMTLSLHDTITDNRTYILARYNDAQGQIIRDQGDFAGAIPYFQKAYEGFIQPDGSRWAAPYMPLYLSECYLKTGDPEKALQYGLQCLELDKALNSDNTLIKKRMSLLLSEIYEQLGNQSMAYNYLKMHQKIRSESDKLDEANRVADGEVRAIIDKSQQEIDLLERERVQTIQKNRIQRLWIFSIAGALLSAIILALILLRNNKTKQKANALLKEQKEEIESTLEKLESTQSQLIQSEKMASLGELTAGIAHEIQNPLNFVNNFSEVNTELIEELIAERSKLKGERNEAIEGDILKDIQENETKIKHHGQRASGIVKGMLEHSRSGNGVKEPTDLNTLADEYLRLAYHGLRAKDKSFNADFKTEFDAALPKINVIPQDIGRVLLNLINNAFYAVDKKAKSGIEGYKPEVVVSTKKHQNSIEISVEDNAGGIPEEIKDKIFQPFFTTKPTGQGTGLGLSLSYDIVKAHGGELSVQSKAMVRTKFIVELPINI